MKTVLSFILVFCSLALFSQGPWTQEKNKFYTQLSYSTISNYTELFGNPDYKSEREITDQTIQLYSEYGLSDKTTLLLILPLKVIETGELSLPINVLPITSRGTETTLGNLQLGIKHNFSNNGWLVSGQVSIEANTSSYNQSSGIRTGYDAWSVTPLLLVGKGFNRSYVQGFFGTDIRTNGYSSNLKIGGEYGKKLGKSIWLIGFLDITKSLKNGNVVLSSQNKATGLYVNDQEFGAFGIKGIAEITDDFGFNTGVGGAFFGNNVAKQIALTFGVFHKF